MDTASWHIVTLWVVAVILSSMAVASVLQAFGLPQQPPAANRSSSIGSLSAVSLLAFVAFAMYGSWVPFHFQRLSLVDALARLQQVPAVSTTVVGSSDWVANLLLFVPIGYFGAALVLTRCSSWRFLAAYAGVLGGCTLLSLVLEICQLWLPPRTPSQDDILAQALGASAGGLLYLVLGDVVPQRMLAFAVSRRPKHQLEWILEVYALGLLAFSLFPLDLSLSLTQIARKFREGKIALFPTVELDDLTFLEVYQICQDALLFVPIGMLATTWRTPQHQPVRRWWQATSIASVFAAGIELMQLLVYSRFSSVSDIVFATVGAGLGAWLVVRRKGAGEREPLSSSTLRGAWWLGVAAVYSAGLLAATVLTAGDWITDTSEIKRRYVLLFQVPLVELYGGDPFHALGQVTQNLLLFAPLGVLGALVANAMTTRVSTKRFLLGGLLLAVSGVALAMELIQICVPDRYPTLTDAALRTVGAALAMFVADRILRQRSSRRLGGEPLHDIPMTRTR